MSLRGAASKVWQTTKFTKMIKRRTSVPLDVDHNLEHKEPSHTSTGKVFTVKTETNIEMQYIYNILKTNGGYEKTLFDDRFLKEQKNSENQTLLILRLLLSPQKSIDTKILNNCLNLLKNKVNELSNSELQEVLALCSKLLCPSNCLRSLDRMFELLDSECSKRLNISWSVNEALIVAEIWRSCSFLYTSNFVWLLMEKYLKQHESLTPAQIVQQFYIMSWYRTIPPKVGLNTLETLLLKLIPKLSIDETAVVCLGLFKTETKIRNKQIMLYVIEHLHNNLNSCNPSTLLCICKYIRYSIFRSLDQEVYELQTKLIPIVPNLPLTVLTHVALLGTSDMLYNQGLIDAVLKQFKLPNDDIRLKDLERLLLVVMMFNIEDKEFCEMAVEQIRKKNWERVTFPESFVHALKFLAGLAYYPADLLDLALSDNFFSTITEQDLSMVQEDLAFIDTCIEIERPEYKGARMSQKIRQCILTRAFFEPFMYAGNHFDTFSEEVKSCLVQTYGSTSFVHTCIIDIFTQKDFLIGFDRSLALQSVPPSWNVIEKGKMKRPPDDENVWIVIVLGSRNSVLRGECTPVGQIKFKLRLLEKLGYVPLLLTFTDWPKISTDQLRSARIRHFINEKIRQFYAEERKECNSSPYETFKECSDQISPAPVSKHTALHELLLYKHNTGG